jgi:hypothetical protein
VGAASGLSAPFIYFFVNEWSMLVQKQVPFHIKSGIPFGKSIQADLPDDRDWWLDDTEFEVLAQIREASSYESPLILDLTQFLTVTFVPGVMPVLDAILIDLRMSGDDTRKVTKSGFYDFIISDPFQEDAYAVPILEGPVYRTAVVTSDTEVL